MIRQTTLKAPIHCTGIGLHTGVRVRMMLRPALVNTGITFVRSDVPAARATVHGRWDRVVDTRLCTIIANNDGTTVSTIEHLMAALYGAGVDNAVVELSGPEVPVVDGSAAPFIFLIECAGLVELEVPRKVLRVLREVRVQDGEKAAMLAPAPYSAFNAEIHFDAGIIGRQTRSLILGQDSFKNEISQARTFGLLRDVEAMRIAGFARGGSLDNAVVVDGDRVLNEGGLRFADEFVRHKILDAVGDLYTAGYPVIGAWTGFKPGHALNNRLLRALFADRGAWRLEDAAVEPTVTATPFEAAIATSA